MKFINIFKIIQRTIIHTPKCINCNYFYIPRNIKEKSIYSETKCMKFLSFKTDGRGPEFEYSYIARSDKTMCGPKGLYFKKISDPGKFD